ncbi:Maf family protein [Ahrensia marina]|uniref:Maf family protein n=1 Tax=Ahrensia marina TaxID=1514904 RepID=UPI0035CFDE7C
MSNPMNPAKLVLASGSSVRQWMLKGAGLNFQVLTADIDERALEAERGGLSPEVLAQELAIAKAQAVSAVVSQTNPNVLVIGADQVLEHDGVLLHKAANSQEAEEKLKRLQASTHHLIAATALVRDGQTLWSGSDRASLTMRALSDKERAAYLDRAGDAATQSVGAYRLEELGSALFERIEGDYFTILGLPLLPLLSALRAQGIDPLLDTSS